MDEQKPTISIRISLTGPQQDAMNRLIEHFEVTNYQELIRAMVTKNVLELKDRIFKSGGMVSAEGRPMAPSRLAKKEREDEVDRIMAMSDEELTAYLLQVGFSPEMSINSSTGKRHYFEMYTYPHDHEKTELRGKRMYCEIYDIPGDSSSFSRAGNCTMPQLIKYLKKEKILK